MGLGRTELTQVLNDFDLSPSRALGQNFLSDPNVASKIARMASVCDTDWVLEIGPGVGSLTTILAERAHHVVAVEYDRYVIPALRHVLASRGQINVTPVSADAMEVDYGHLLAASSEWKLVANLPYNISTPLVLRLLEEVPAVVEMVVMVQKEVGERLCAKPGSSLFSQVALKLGYYAKAKMAANISREVFMPRPNVDSVVVRIERENPAKYQLDRDRYDLLFSLARRAYSNRRQMLRRTLGSTVAIGVFEAAGIDPTRRPETLSLDEWVELVAKMMGE